MCRIKWECFSRRCLSQEASDDITICKWASDSGDFHVGNLSLARIVLAAKLSLLVVAVMVVNKAGESGVAKLVDRQRTKREQQQLLVPDS